eukprot:13488027-Heterocapsa_arctica.AAC.1
MTIFKNVAPCIGHPDLIGIIVHIAAGLHFPPDVSPQSLDSPVCGQVAYSTFPPTFTVLVP